MSIAEQIAALEATRAAKAAQLETVAEKSMEAGETMTAEEGEEFDTLSDDIKAVDVDLKRLRQLEKIQGQKAKPAEGQDPKAAAQSRAGYATVKNTQKPAPGVEFARYAICLAAGQGNLMQSYEIAKSRYPESERVVTAIKANVEAGSTEDNVLAEQQTFTGDFIEHLRPQTIVGQIQGFARVPFNVKVNGGGGSVGYWVGEGKPAPVSSLSFASVSLDITKLASIVPLTQELVRSSSPSAELIVRNDLERAIIAKMDNSFIDPTHAGTSRVSPASVSYGVEAITSSGTTAAKVRADLKALWTTFIAANVTPAAAVYVMSATTALALSLMTEQSGARSFPDTGMNGGMLNGVPVITSEHVGGIADEADGTPGRYVFLINAADIFLADDDQVTLDASREATLEMSDSPDGTGVMRNLWQANMIAIRATRFVNWAKRRPSAVAMLDGVNYG